VSYYGIKCTYIICLIAYSKGPRERKTIQFSEESDCEAFYWLKSKSVTGEAGKAVLYMAKLSMYKTAFIWKIMTSTDREFSEFFVYLGPQAFWTRYYGSSDKRSTHYYADSIVLVLVIKIKRACFQVCVWTGSTGCRLHQSKKCDRVRRFVQTSCIL
jgi:hypothetical protein